ncbi:MAG: hypothetical protein DRH50_14460 [Deltaproteobacteria bacterium]|nr:MAG: hypothetical protein DRH50_14460 [Deltaproteobacteria bacterium]
MLFLGGSEAPQTAGYLLSNAPCLDETEQRTPVRCRLGGSLNSSLPGSQLNVREGMQDPLLKIIQLFSVRICGYFFKLPRPFSW